MNKWLLHDLSGTISDYRFAINPNTMSSPLPAHVLSLNGATIHDGVRGQGRIPPHEWTFGGLLYERGQYERLRDYVLQAGRTELTDHLGRTFLVRLNNFDPIRAGTRKHPWRHKYNMRVITYGGPL
jgi:hypothetical protein